MHIKESRPALSPETIEEMDAYGIRRTSGDYFYCGKYGYTVLKDAIAQAKREQRASAAVETD